MQRQPKICVLRRHSLALQELRSDTDAPGGYLLRMTIVRSGVPNKREGASVGYNPKLETFFILYHDEGMAEFECGADLTGDGDPEQDPLNFVGRWFQEFPTIADLTSWLFEQGILIVDCEAPRGHNPDPRRTG